MVRAQAQLDLTSEQRARLGLGEKESARVLAQSARTILLERTGGGSETPLPFDRDLVLTADVRAFALADLLNLVHAQAKSGFLYFEHGECEKTVYLHRGEVIFATSNQRVDRLGECLVRSGAITQAQQREANASYRPPAPFGRFLVKLGFLSPRDLWDAVKGQVEEIVRSLFAFDLGMVRRSWSTRGSVSATSCCNFWRSSRTSACSSSRSRVRQRAWRAPSGRSWKLSRG